MPRNASGSYTLPSGNPVVSGDNISSTWANDTMGDIATALTNSLARDGSGGMTAPFRAVDGTVSVPGLSFANETGSGLYRSAAGDVGLAILGNQILRMRSTGLDVTGALSYTGTLTGGTGVINIGSGQIYKDASGNVGIGTSSPGFRLDIAGGHARLASNQRFYFGSTTNGGFIDNNFGNDDFLNFACKPSGARFIKSDLNSEFMRIDSIGNLLVATSSNNGISLYGRIHANRANYGGYAGTFGISNTTSGAGILGFFNANGIVGSVDVTGSSTAFVTSSDYRLKEQVAPMTGALAKNELLNPVTYKWKADGSDGQGFIAHELQAVFPDAVTGEKDAVDDEGNPVYQGVDTSFLVGHLVACVKELNAKVAALEATL